MKKYIVLLIAALGLNITGFSFATDDKLNRISVYGAAFVPFPTLLELGLGYDRILSPRWAITAIAQYSFIGLMHSGYVGGGLEVGAKFFIWGHGDFAFEKGFFAQAGTGLYGMMHEFDGDLPSLPRGRPKRIYESALHMPLSLRLGYMYTFKTKVFLSVGLNSQLFFLAIPLENTWPYVLSLAMPKLEAALGYAF